MENAQTVNKNLIKNQFSTRIINSAIIIYALLLCIMGIYPSATNWGMHYLAFYPPLVRFSILLMILLLVNSTVRRYLVERLEELTIDFNKNKKIKRSLFSFIALVVFGALLWICRTATHFLGDGYLLLRNISTVASDLDIFVNTREPFVGFLILKINKILLALGFANSVELAYRVLSILSGMMFLVLVWYLARLMSKNRIERTLIILFISASGASQLFFGYVENYALTYTGITFFILSSLAYIQRSISMILPIIVFSFLVVINYATLIFLPAFIPLIQVSFQRKEIRKNILFCIAGSVLVPILLWISDVTPKMIIEEFAKGSGHIVPLTHHPSIYYSYTLFSLGHAIDVFNLLFMSHSTAFILLFSSGWLLRIRGKWSGEKRFLLLMMFCGTLFITLLNCELGMSRDWDLLAPFSIVFSIAAVYGWFQEIQEPATRRSLLLALTVVGIIQTGFWIGINTNEKRALQRLDLLQDDPHWSTHAKSILFEERAIFHRERLEFSKEAMYYERAVTLQPSHSRILANLAETYLDIGDTLKSIEIYNRIEALEQADARVHQNLGLLYAQTQQYDSALHHWYLADALDSTSSIVPFNIGVTIATYKNSRKKALPYFLKVIKRDSLYAEAYYYAGRCYEEMGELLMAREYYKRYNKLMQVHQ